MESNDPNNLVNKENIGTGELTYAGWSDTFLMNLRSRFHGPNLTELAQLKPDVAALAHNFAGNHMPTDALEVAQVAHIAELAHRFNLSPNIGRALTEAFSERLQGVTPEEWVSDVELMPIKYTFSLMRDFPIIADYIKAHEIKCKKAGHEYIDVLGLVDLVEKTNFESIIIKSALDYTNFLMLDAKEYLTDKEKSKMRRIITAMKTVDSPLLALTGFDALEAEILSKAYEWELKQAGDAFFVSKATDLFEELGGRTKLAKTTEEFQEELFTNDIFDHQRVTADQEYYGVFFGEGAVTFAEYPNEFRVLARLKSVGATAKKMHALYNKTEALETPIDIVGLTLVAKDEDEMSQCLTSVMGRLSRMGVSHVSAPSRAEQVHVKGSDEFLSRFGKDGMSAHLYEDKNLLVKDELCNNGYEAVKLTLSYAKDGLVIPIEIQITHETARKESRVGQGSHTIFKLMKLAKDAGDITISKLSNSDMLEKLQRISIRKQKFDRASYETNGESTVRADRVFKNMARNIGGVAIQ